MKALRNTRCKFDAVADRATRQVITDKAKARERLEQATDLRYALAMAHIILRHRSRVSPDHLLHRFSPDAHNPGVFRVNRARTLFV